MRKKTHTPEEFLPTLRQAETGSIELDHRYAELFGYKNLGRAWRTPRGAPKAAHGVPSFTTSIDAGLDLARTVIPDYQIAIQLDLSRPERLPIVRINHWSIPFATTTNSPSDRKGACAVRAPTIALALAQAILLTHVRHAEFVD